jgi:AraC-like DNA-binding protein
MVSPLPPNVDWYLNVFEGIALLSNLAQLIVQDEPDIARLAVSGASIVHCRLPRWEAGHYRSHSLPCSIGLSFTGQSCVTAANGKTRDDVIAPRNVVVTGPQRVEWLRVNERSEFIEISADKNLRLAVADELGIPHHADLGMLRVPGDGAAWAIAARLRSLCRNFQPGDDLAAETLVRLFYGKVLTQCFGGRSKAKGVGALDSRRLARVTDYIDARLGARLSLNALAQVAALSPFHFLRSFRLATGCTPHRYVAMKRAEHAQARLALGHAPKAVTQAMGYSDERRMRAALQSHIGEQVVRPSL